MKTSDVLAHYITENKALAADNRLLREENARLANEVRHLSHRLTAALQSHSVISGDYADAVRDAQGLRGIMAQERMERLTEEATVPCDRCREHEAPQDLLRTAPRYDDVL